MCIALIGGMDRLERRYVMEAERVGISLKVFNGTKPQLISRMGNVDAMVIFTNKVSHCAKREAMGVAKSRNIPVFLHHSCGVCTLRQCIECLKNPKSEVGHA
jgi:hypothetical protein